MTSQTSLARPGEIIETTAGKIRGGVEKGVHVFRGVPYGASTAAARFLRPRAAQPWTGIRDATELGLRAPQPAFNPPPGPLAEISATTDAMGEDCLCLNVWTPGADTGKRPVMVWLHGGGFAVGSGGQPAYAGTELAAKRDVVVVTVNHRLNVFGYLYLAEFNEQYADSGNVGTLDIVLALEWVRGNIAAFGGDPGNVTIFGESGGGMKVSVLMAMPAACGLFHRAIIQSGALLKAMPRDRAARNAELFLAKLGLATGRVAELEKLPMEQLLEAIPVIPGGVMGPAPVADGRAFPGHPFDPGAPAISAGVPLLIGSNATEMTLLELPQEQMDDATLEALAKQRMKVDDAAAGPLLAAYKKAHRSNVEAWLALESDRFMRINSIRQAERQAALSAAPANNAALSAAPVYMYFFTWRTPVLGGRLRSAHALEIPFVFDHPDVWQGFTGTGDDRYPLADKMSGAWAEFARTGKPGDPNLPDWPAYTRERRATMILDNMCQVVDDPEGSDRLAYLASGGGSVSLFE
jgi:para-nitrobenzyl esterase